MKTLLLTFSITFFLFSSAHADNIYVANVFSNSVRPVDGTTLRALPDIPAGLAPEEIAVSPAGDMIYVASWNSFEIVVIDPRLQAVKERIPLSCSPSSLAMLPSGTEALSVCRTTGQVIRIDLAQKRQTASLSVSFPHSITVNPAGTVAYVSRSMFASSVEVINLGTFQRVATVTVGRSPQGLAVSPDGKFLYVANNGAGTVSIVNASTLAVKAVVAVGSAPRNIAVSPDGSTLYVTNYNSGTVSVIDAALMKVTHTVPAGVNPHGIAVDSSGRRFYVANYSSNSLSIIDAVTFSPLATVPTGIGPLGVGVARFDKVPPQTVPSLSGVRGRGDWYVSEVHVELAASDDDSGVREIRYTIDGAAEAIYAGRLAISGDGAHVLSYYAVDNAGNVEPVKKLTVNIDQTPPVASVSLSRTMIWPPNHKMVDVVVNGTTADSGSGVAAVDIAVHDEYGVYGGNVSGFGGVVRLEAWRDGSDMDGRHYTITVVVTDEAGNSATAATDAVVPHDMR